MELVFKEYFFLLDQTKDVATFTVNILCPSETCLGLLVPRIPRNDCISCKLRVKYYQTSKSRIKT